MISHKLIGMDYPQWVLLSSKMELKNMNISKEKSILEELAISNPELAEDLEKRLFTTDVIHRISSKDLQKILHTFEDKEIDTTPLLAGYPVRQVPRTVPSRTSL